MPRYDYECSSCSHTFELKQGFDSEPVAICPICEGSSRRKFHAVPIIYKGSGFYTTDYARSGRDYTSKVKEEAKQETESSTKSKAKEKNEAKKSDSTGNEAKKSDSTGSKETNKEGKSEAKTN